MYVLGKRGMRRRGMTTLANVTAKGVSITQSESISLKEREKERRVRKETQLGRRIERWTGKERNSHLVVQERKSE